jgi:hypothetical protein
LDDLNNFHSSLPFVGQSFYRSTKLLVQHMIDNEQIPRPEYLIEAKMFEAVPEKAAYVPLYEIFDG